jgi:hypothetical protein
MNDDTKKSLKSLADLTKGNDTTGLLKQLSMHNSVLKLTTSQFENVKFINYAAENNKELKEVNGKLDEQIFHQKALISNQEIIINALVTNLRSANHTLDLILNSLGANSQKNQQLLIELQQILQEEQRDNEPRKLRSFVDKHGFEAICAILQLIELSLGKGS